MKHLKKILAVLLCAAIAISTAGCGGPGGAPGGGGSSGGKEAAMGRFVETTVELPGGENLSDLKMVRNEGGSYELLAFEDDADKKNSKLLQFHSEDGKAWEKIDAPWADAVRANEKGFTSFEAVAADGKGGVFAIIKDKEGMLRLFLSADGKTAKEIPVPSWEEMIDDPYGEGSVIKMGAGMKVNDEKAEDEEAPSKKAPRGRIYLPRQMEISDDGSLVVLFMGQGIACYRPDGKLIKDYSFDAMGGGAMSFALSGDVLSAMGYDGKIKTYSLKTGEVKGSLAEDGEDAGGNMAAGGIMQCDAEGSLYLCSSTGIKRVAKGGSLWEVLVEGGAVSLGSPALQLKGFSPDGKGGFFAAMFQNGKLNKLVHYVYDKSVPALPDTELVVYSLRDSPTVRQAASAFQLANPNVRVSLRIGLDSESSATLTDVVRALNTELLAGKGPDIIILDGLPANSYMEKGVLKDLTGIVPTEGLMENILKSYARDGKLCAIPARFKLPAILGEKSSLEGVSGVEDLAKAGGDKPLLYIFSPESFLETLANASFSAWVTDKKLDKEKLTSFLKNAETVYNKFKIPDGDGTAMTVTMVSQIGNGVAYSVGETKYMMKDVRGTLSTLSSLTQLKTLGGEGEARFMPGQAEGAFLPMVSAGINAGSQKQELAADFLKMLISQETQDYEFNDGFPVNLASREKFLKNMAKEDAGAKMPDLSLLDRANQPMLIDNVLMQAVLEQGVKCLNGEISVEEAVKKIAEDTEIYLSE